jgi:glutamate dehydrogenase (NAD(P)+)
MPFKRNVYDRAIYQEPTPIPDRDNPFKSMMERFDIAAQILELDPCPS